MTTSAGSAEAAGTGDGLMRGTLGQAGQQGAESSVGTERLTLGPEQHQRYHLVMPMGSSQGEGPPKGEEGIFRGLRK